MGALVSNMISITCLSVVIIKKNPKENYKDLQHIQTKKKENEHKFVELSLMSKSRATTFPPRNQIWLQLLILITTTTTTTTSSRLT
ncbi:hypothetical protein Scep_029208 [Stephania cephalantha]|uniref:Uncharacterized protein n=1 Tax=Stephania cephalantha TaxID=152367 RepID=A0AAP0HFE0_9MAGN